jgi:hypothetical protein
MAALATFDAVSKRGAYRPLFTEEQMGCNVFAGHFRALPGDLFGAAIGEDCSLNRDALGL